VKRKCGLQLTARSNDNLFPESGRGLPHRYESARGHLGRFGPNDMSWVLPADGQQT
jgi:hypothetical protein